MAWVSTRKVSTRKVSNAVSRGADKEGEQRAAVHVVLPAGPTGYSEKYGISDSKSQNARVRAMERL